MIAGIVIAYFALSAIVSTVLIGACILAGRPQKVRVSESAEVRLAIAEVKLPCYHLRPSLSSQ